MDTKDLKIEALLQRLSEVAREYENRVADLRVEITQLVSENQRLRDEAEDD